MRCHTNWFVVLTACTLFITTAGQQLCPGGQVCGKNALCEYKNREAKCACDEGYNGDPLTECIKNECSKNSDCASHQHCVDYKCKDICVGMCGHMALCNINPENNIPVCSCPQGFTGDALKLCRPLGPQEVCEVSSPCGNNTICRVKEDRITAICSCKEGYKGNPLIGCEPECHKNKDCFDHQECMSPGCKNVCNPSPCGKDAYCIGKNHRSQCQCFPNRIGDPWTGCNAECKNSSSCPYDRPVCFHELCINPCLKNNGGSACGKDARCVIKYGTAICSCPRGYTGNALEECRPLKEADICKMVKCGEKAVCAPKKQKDGHYIAICSCPRLHKGNALKKCHPVECDEHDDCPKYQTCRNWKCHNPCPSSCGEGATCLVNAKRVIVCGCPPGTHGNPMLKCKATEN